MIEWLDMLIMSALAGVVFAGSVAVIRGLYLSFQRRLYARRFMELSVALSEVHEAEGIEGVIKVLADAGFSHSEEEENGDKVHVFIHEDGVRVIKFRAT